MTGLMGWFFRVVIIPMFALSVVALAHAVAIEAATGQWYLFAKTCAVLLAGAVLLATATTRESASRARRIRRVRK